MPRIPEDELARLKAEVSLVRLVEASGITLQKRGAELFGLCPFHDDHEPSLSVNLEKNLFHCFGCNASGDVIEWTMKRQGVSFRHAVELLKEGAPDEAARSSSVKPTPTRRLPAPVRLEADDQQLLNQVVSYYHDTLKQNPEALEYLRKRGLVHPELIERFKLGYANRTLGLRLPEKNRKAGSEVRSRLERIGLYRESGHEHFNGSLIIPVMNEGGNVQQVYGRKIRSDLRVGTPLHLYLPGPHRGVWNLQGLKGGRGEIILCESLIDAMSFWAAGYRNVTTSYGVNGFTEEHLAAFKAHDIERVLIAYDRDEPGERAANELAAHLIEAGLTCFRIEFPKTMDANLYAQRMTPASKSLGVLIRKASWLGKGKAPRLTSAPVDELEAVLAVPAHAPSAAELIAAAPAAFAAKEELPEPLPEPTYAAALPIPPAADDPVTSKNEQELNLKIGDRAYRVRGWAKPLNPDMMKVNLLVHRPRSDSGADSGTEDGRFHVDTFDLYNAKARAAFVKQAGIELGEPEDVLKHDLGRILMKIEALQDAELSQALKKDPRQALSEEDRAADGLVSDVRVAFADATARSNAMDSAFARGASNPTASAILNLATLPLAITKARSLTALGQAGRVGRVEAGVDAASDAARAAARLATAEDALRGLGVTDAALRQRILAAGFDPAIMQGASPGTRLRFDDLFQGTLDRGVTFSGSRGILETRVAAIARARELERTGYDVAFEVRHPGPGHTPRFADIVATRGGERRIVQFELNPGSRDAIRNRQWFQQFSTVPVEVVPVYRTPLTGP